MVSLKKYPFPYFLDVDLLLNTLAVREEYISKNNFTDFEGINDFVAVLIITTTERLNACIRLGQFRWKATSAEISP